MNLTFVTIHVERSSRAVPLAAGMLASAVRAILGDSVRTALADFYLDDDAETAAAVILSGEPDCVGFSVYVWNRPLTFALAPILRARKPGLVLFAGGPEVSADPAAFNSGDLFDFAIPGEGESLATDAILLLLEGARTSTIRKAVEFPSAPDLGRLPSPWLDGTLDPAACPGVLWELSRGCPFSCHFCYESRGNRGVRVFPEERIRRELELFSRSGVREIFVLDPTFNHDRGRAARMIGLMRDTAPEIRYFLEVRSEFLDRKTAGLFASLSCSLQIGLQSAHREVLKNVGRTIDREDFSRKVLLLHEAGVTYGFDLIYGLPGDSLSGFLESLDFALEMVPNHVDIFPLEVLPGTVLRETAPGFGLEFEQDSPYTVRSSPSWSPIDLQRAAAVTEAFDCFYNRGNAVPWFRLVLANLEMKPSVFFRELGDRLSGNPPENIAAFQREYLSALFEERGRPGSARISEDLVAAFASAEGEAEDYAFTFDPDSLVGHIESGVEDFEELAFFVPRSDA